MKACFKTQVFDNVYETCNRLVMDFIRYTEYMLQFRENLYIALSGGNTPQTMFSIIAKEYPLALNWEKLHFFWVDERCVPQESNESNFGVADRLLFQKVNIPRLNLHPIHGNNDPLNEVIRYSGEILTNIPCSNKFPIFDLIILGMGDDGHTASIFPGQLDLFESPAICSVSENPYTKQKRITLTGKVLNNSQDIVFLVTGNNKSKRLEEIFNNLTESKLYPVTKVKPVSGRVSWYFDKDATVLIENLV